MVKAKQEFNNQVEERFLNKNYYNPEYMYNTEGPEIMRLYNDKDNTQNYTFTDVLDATYNGVPILLFSGWVLSITTPCSSVLFSMLLNRNGPSTIPMRKDLFRPDSEENMPSDDTQRDKKGTIKPYPDALPANYVLQPVQQTQLQLNPNPDQMDHDEQPDTTSTWQNAFTVDIAKMHVL